MRPDVSLARWRQPGLLVLCLVLTGCGSKSPAAPTPTFPNVAGSWAGDYQLTACSDQDAPGFCGGYPPVGSVGPVRLALQQNDDRLTGTLTLGEFIVPVTGSVTSTGQITLTGKSQTVSAAVGGVNFSVQLTVSNWNTQASGVTMTGSWRETFDLSGDITGRAVTENTIRTLTRS